MKSKLLVVLLSLVLFAGCNRTTDAKKTEEAKETSVTTQETADSSSATPSTTEKDKLSAPVVVDGVEITIQDMTVSDSVNKEGQDEKLYMFSVAGKNVSPQKKGLGAIDFKIKTKDGEEKGISTDMMAFGDEIDPDGTITGKLYFSLDPDEEAAELEYIVGDKVMKTWQLS